MNTIKTFLASPPAVPAHTAWYLSDIGESRGKQELYSRRSPQLLKTLREHALVESAVSSNRLEGVTVDRARVATVVFGKSRLRDRDEEEVRGYRDALKLIHEQGKGLDISERTIQMLHRLAKPGSGDAGRYKQTDGDIIEQRADGRARVRFKPVAATNTPPAMTSLVSLWNRGIEEGRVPPPILLAAWNLDFLCVHPFRDGNGRVSRLLMLLQCYHLGIDVGRYISLEKLIEENKDLYYEALETSSRGWHDSQHDPWPYINFVLYTIKAAYREFEGRVGSMKSPRGAKTELVIAAVRSFPGPFSLADLERGCPGVSRDMIRIVLRRLKEKGEVAPRGRGPGALWEKR
jgi:Fic family protein